MTTAVDETNMSPGRVLAYRMLSATIAFCKVNVTSVTSFTVELRLLLGCIVPTACESNFISSSSSSSLMSVIRNAHPSSNVNNVKTSSSLVEREHRLNGTARFTKPKTTRGGNCSPITSTERDEPRTNVCHRRNAVELCLCVVDCDNRYRRNVDGRIVKQLLAPPNGYHATVYPLIRRPEYAVRRKCRALLGRRNSQ